MSQKKIRPQDIQFTSVGCIVFAINKLSDSEHVELVEHVDGVVKSYEVSGSCTASTTKDGFLEIFFSLNTDHIDREELAEKLSVAINSFQPQD